MDKDCNLHVVVNRDVDGDGDVHEIRAEAHTCTYTHTWVESVRVPD